MAVVMKIKLEEHTYTNTLSIQVSLDGFSFYAQNEHSNDQHLLAHYVTNEPGDPDNILLDIEQVFEENKDLSSVFNNIEVVYRNELFTIVPIALFDPERLTDYLKYNTKILSTDFIVYDELKPYDLVVVYIPFANINNFFFDRFGSFSYHHNMTLFIKDVLDNAVANKKQAVVSLTDTSFDLIAHEGKKMLLANSFSYENPEDFLYHILFCYEQLNFDPDEDKLIIKGEISSSGELYQLAHTYIRHISLAEETSSDSDAQKISLS